MDNREPNDGLLPLLLEICEDFFTGTSATVLDEVDARLRARDITGGSGWLIDMLALTRRRLEGPAEPGHPSSRQDL